MHERVKRLVGSSPSCLSSLSSVMRRRLPPPRGDFPTAAATRSPSAAPSRFTPPRGRSPAAASVPPLRSAATSAPAFRPAAAADASYSELPAAGDGDSAPWGLILLAGEVLSLGFPVWVASACALALWRPPAFLWVSPTARMVGLSFTMLGMSMTLTLDDLKTALVMPKELAVGFLLQYTVMPLSGFLVSKLLKLPSHYAAGLILVSCCPGGTASNIVTYLARVNVALSVLMTAASTFPAAFMTPPVTSKLAGQYVAVDPMGLFISTSQVVLAPVLLGALLNQFCNGLVQLVSPLIPFIAVATVAVPCGNAIAQNASAILASGIQVVLPVCCLHALGFFSGYVVSRIPLHHEQSPLKSACRIQYWV